MNPIANTVIEKENQFIAKGSLLKHELSLNLGCNNRTFEGWVNIDKHHICYGVSNYDMQNLPYKDGEVSRIFSAHSLEHLGIRQAKQALREWYRVLRVGGQLMLSIPDLELIMRNLLREDCTELEWAWGLYTLFGFQTDPANNDWLAIHYKNDLGQYHRCGFTKKSLLREVETIGFKVIELQQFDGNSTPSLFLLAEKP